MWDKTSNNSVIGWLLQVFELVYHFTGLVVLSELLSKFITLEKKKKNRTYEAGYVMQIVSLQIMHYMAKVNRGLSIVLCKKPQENKSINQ